MAAMIDKEFFTMPTEHFTIEGRSRAGHETWFRIRDLSIALDIGRCPDLLIHMPDIFITHTHLDHSVGIPFYAGQRRLQQLEGGRVHVPAEVAADVREMLKIYERLTGAGFEIEIVGVAAGEEIPLGKKYLVRAHAAPHRVAARAWEFIERRHHLLEEFAGREPGEIARLRREGVVVDEEYRSPVLLYTGDTDRGFLESCEAAFHAEVLMIECSFVAEGHQDRAVRYRHLHIDDIADFAGRFENDLIVLTHFSRRYSREEIQQTVRRRLPAALRERVRLALPEPWQRV